MGDTLQHILAFWGREDDTPVPVTGAGAAIAAAVWDLDERWSLKTGTNFEGLRHHIHISKVLQRNGISASCPLPTLTGEDFVTCREDGPAHYYVITEKMTDCFLSTELTDPALDAAMFGRYAAEAGNFQAALFARTPVDQELTDVLAWAREKTAATAAALGHAYPLATVPVQETMEHLVLPNAAETADRPLAEGEGFVCATRHSLSGAGLCTVLGIGSAAAGTALVHMLEVFIAWTGGQERFAQMRAGNLATIGLFLA